MERIAANVSGARPHDCAHVFAVRAGRISKRAIDGRLGFFGVLDFIYKPTCALTHDDRVNTCYYLFIFVCPRVVADDAAIINRRLFRSVVCAN